MAPRIPREVQEEMNTGFECYTFEREDLGTDEIIDSNYEWNQMIETSNKLKQKYPFLSDFMDKNRINVVREMEYDDNILGKSGSVTYYEHDADGIKYYVVKNNSEIIEIPYEITDWSDDSEVSDNGFNGKKVGDFVDENTTHILQHNYSNSGNEWSPLYVIPYNK